MAAEEIRVGHDFDGNKVPRWTEYVNVEELVPDPRNPKEHDHDTLDASLQRFGYTEPVMVDERTGTLVAGHGRRDLVLRARDAGAEPPNGVVVADDGRWMVPVARGWSSRDDDEALAYIVASNRLVERGGWAEELLVDALQVLESTDRMLDGVGYNAQEVEDMLAALTPPMTLEQMADLYGEPGEADMWPVLRFKVPPGVRERFVALVDGIDADDAQFTALVEWAEKGKGV